MKEMVINYLIDELKKSSSRADEIYSKLSRHPDILNEFCYWIEKKTYHEDDKAIIIQGYSAKRLSKETFLEPLGIFNFLIYLREKPEDALHDLKKGLPRK